MLLLIKMAGRVSERGGWGVFWDGFYYAQTNVNNAKVAIIFGWHSYIKPLIMLSKNKKSHNHIKNCCSTAQPAPGLYMGNEKNGIT